jgi:hypothetical protein
MCSPQQIIYDFLSRQLCINEAEERKEENAKRKIIRQNSIINMVTLKIVFLFLLSSDFVHKIFAGVGDHWNYEDYG